MAYMRSQPCSRLVAPAMGNRVKLGQGSLQLRQGDRLGIMSQRAGVSSLRPWPVLAKTSQPHLVTTQCLPCPVQGGHLGGLQLEMHVGLAVARAGTLVSAFAFSPPTGVAGPQHPGPRSGVISSWGSQDLELPELGVGDISLTGAGSQGGGRECNQPSLRALGQTRLGQAGPTQWH